MILHRLSSYARGKFQMLNAAIVGAGMQWRSRDYRLQDAAGTAIVFSPHPDDEVLGCGGLIINRRMLGATVYIVFMTDGRASHKSRFIDPAALAGLRTAEARACAGVLGVPQENLIFLAFEDGFLARDEVMAQTQVGRILRAVSPSEIFVPFRHEAPADHRATYRIVRQALQQDDRRNLPPVVVHEYFVWTLRLRFWEIRELRASAGWLRLDVRRIRDLKQRALACYRSQTTALYPDPQWATLPGDLLAWCAQPYEFYLRREDECRA